MNYQEVFSWAEDKSGKMVYVDDVPRGVACNCVCPYCRENLIARHGTERTHGFAHASKERGANLKICLKVIVFKLAEQIIKTEKRIYMPSYYGIFKPKSVEFETVEINGDFEREDRQPDIIATTKDNQKYLIEFCFKDYVRYKQEIDSENLNCLEIDLAGQKIDDRDSLKNFLLNFYLGYVCRHMQKDFPHVLSYNCFVERQMRVGIWRALLLLPFQVFISNAAIQALLLVAIFFL